MLSPSYNFFLDLILSSITMSHPGCHASRYCDILEIHHDLQGRQQQQQREDEIKDKAYIEVTTSMEFVVLALKSF